MNKKITKIVVVVAMMLTMTACSSTALSKDEIFSLVLEYEELLQEGVAEILNSDEDIQSIHHTETSLGEFDFTGFFFRTSNFGEIIPLENEVLQDVLELEGIVSIYVGENHIKFDCGASGIVPSSQYFGFYYSVTENPMEVWYGHESLERELLSDGDGWAVTINGNVFNTERIIGNFYYFSWRF